MHLSKYNFLVLAVIVITAHASNIEEPTANKSLHHDTNCVEKMWGHTEVRKSGSNAKHGQFPCLHGGRFHSGVCFCNSGRTGKRCEMDSEIAHPDAGEHLNRTKQMCNLGFEIYPYIQEGLWATAYEDWKGCGGRQQSPIDIRMEDSITGLEFYPRLTTDYKRPDHPIALLNNGHSLKVAGKFGQLTWDDAAFQSKQLHLHHPSEHMVDGRHAELELHIVNTKDNDIAVIGILFDIGAPNPCLSQMLTCPLPIAGCHDPIGPFNLGDCFEEQLSGPHWSYSGSLTTPPCTEGVQWIVMQKRATISKQQLNLFRTRYQMNARATKPLFSRKVTYHRTCKAFPKP